MDPTKWMPPIALYCPVVSTATATSSKNHLLALSAPTIFILPRCQPRSAAPRQLFLLQRNTEGNQFNRLSMPITQVPGPSKAVVDYAFHLIVTDSTPAVLENELPWLFNNGYTSVKVYMTYDL